MLTVKLENVEQKIYELLSEKPVMKSSVEDVNFLLLDIIETHDSMITITVKEHLAEKLRSDIAMLNRLEGVLELSSIPKKGVENVVKPSKKESPNQTVANSQIEERKRTE